MLLLLLLVAVVDLDVVMDVAEDVVMAADEDAAVEVAVDAEAVTTKTSGCP
jgi:hypothetical protein